MTYKFYKDLGFKREELNDGVVKDKTGYGGYFLNKNFKGGIQITVYSDELDKPNLYIPMIGHVDRYHIIPIPVNAVESIIKISQGKSPWDEFDPLSVFHHAC